MKALSLGALVLITTSITLFGSDYYSKEESKFFACTQLCIKEHLDTPWYTISVNGKKQEKAKICANVCTTIFNSREKEKCQKELTQALLAQAQAQQEMTQALIDRIPKQNS